MSIIKFIWFAVLALIVFQFVGALNNDGVIPSSFVANILIFIALTVILALGWVFGLLRKKFGKKEILKPNRIQNPSHSTPDKSQVPEDKREVDDPLLSMLEKGDIYGDGFDADEIPGATGEFGFDSNNPIPVKSVLGANEYLEELTFSDGTKVIYARIGSTSSPNVNHPIDIYELSHENGKKVCTVHVSPYHKRNSSKKPDFQRLNDQLESVSDFIITDPFEPSPELQSIEGVQLYQSKLSKLSESEISIELSNVMTAKHNQMMLPASIDEYVDKQALVSDLTDKAMWICVTLFGQDAISAYAGDNLTRLNQLINELDNDVAQQDLEPEPHGSKLIRKLEDVLSPDNNSSSSNLESVSQVDEVVIPTIRFGQLPDNEIANFQSARDIVFNEESDQLLEAREELTRLYSAGYGEAFSVLGYMAVVYAGDVNDLTDGLKILHKCSDAGDSGSTCLLGNIYEKGQAVEQNLAKAWHYYGKAIEQGSVAALSNKGVMAIQGRGATKDVELGMSLLREAQKKGSSGAQELLKHFNGTQES